MGPMESARIDISGPRETEIKIVQNCDIILIYHHYKPVKVFHVFSIEMNLYCVQKNFIVSPYPERIASKPYHYTLA
jgi:hypothetical protein